MSRLHRWLRGNALLLTSILILPGILHAEEAQAPAAATEVVERLHATLLDVMKNATALGYGGRRDKLAPVLVDVFDISFMAEKSVGRHWKTAAADQRERLLATFTRFTIANYAGRFDGWSGQHFETLGQEPSIRDTVVVRSRLVEKGAEPVQLNYRLRPVNGHWKIVDVYLNGTVSEIALRRSEYSAMIQRDGFQALLVALDEKIEELASTPADQS